MRANFFPAGEDVVGPQARAKICQFFEKELDHRMDRQDHWIRLLDRFVALVGAKDPAGDGA